MNRTKSFLIIVLCTLWWSVAHADRWVPYTDGKAGGCFLGDSGTLYGCTPQPNASARTSTGLDCDAARRRLESAKNDFNRTVTSVRRAEESFGRSGCTASNSRSDSGFIQPQQFQEFDYAAIEAARRREEEQRELDFEARRIEREIQLEQDARTAERNRSGPHCESAEYQALLKRNNITQMRDDKFCFRSDENGIGPTYMNCPPCHRDGNPAAVVERSEKDTRRVGETASTSQAWDNIDYDTLLRGYEAKYPQMNPDSPSYDEALTLRIGASMQRLMANGTDVREALVVAVSQEFVKRSGREK